jgi:hypothetical protein
MRGAIGWQYGAAMKTLIFYGPSITACEVTRLTTATHAPPIKRGDLDAIDDHAVIVILDGEFGQNFSVSPKEILRAIERGKIVIGASSMGALRASELDRSGMIGIGWVYNHFRGCAVRRDDDVALVYCPFELKPMTVPVIDVEYWVSLLLADGHITRKDKARFVRVARSIFFSDRTEERLIEAFRHAFGAQRVDWLLKATGGGMPNIKALDAQAAIHLANSLAQPADLRSGQAGHA